MSSHEIDVPLEEYWPEDQDVFGLSVTLEIGLSGVEGADYFGIVICTPDWIKKEYAKSGHVWGKSMFIVMNYNFLQIKSEIEKYLSRCQGDSWADIAQQVSRLAAWEFENYQG